VSRLVRNIIQFFETVGLELSNFLQNASRYFLPVKNSAYYQPPTEPLVFPVADKPVYATGLAILLLTWFVFSVATITFLVASFLPGHLGLGDLLRAFGQLLPTDPVIDATRVT
jgi:hypothetical protein